MAVPPPTTAADRDGPRRDTAGEVGSRLRALRKLHGISQRELARRAGVTNGTISLIEQDRVSPTVSSLRKVLGGFPLTIAEFFGAELDPRAQIFYRRDQLTEIRGQSLVLRQVGPRMRGRRLQVLHERYGPGGDTGESMLAHEGQEAGVIVQGRIEITVGGQQRTLGPGDAYYFDSRVPHRFRNVSSEPAEIVSACTPPSF